MGGELTLADFEPPSRSGAVQELSDVCPPPPQGTVQFALEPAQRCGHSGACLRLRYAFPESLGTPIGWRIDLPRINASRFDSLALWLRGDPETGYDSQIEVGFRRSDPERPELPQMGTVVIRGVTSEWQRFVVPLAQMTGIREWSDLEQLVFVMHPGRTQVKNGAFLVDDVTLFASSVRGKPSQAPLFPRGKQAWEQALGGRHAALAAVRARLGGWPDGLLAEAPGSTVSDELFLRRVARDTWRGLDALVDQEHGLPLDHIRFDKASIAVEDTKIGDYTSPTNIGLRMIAVVAARDLGLIGEEEALGRLHVTIATVERLQTYHGAWFNYYDTVSLERTSHFVSFVDCAWLTAGLIVVRQAFPLLWDRCTRLIEQTDYRFFHDQTWGLMLHGYYTNVDAYSQYHYGVLYSEARLGSLIAMGKLEVPEAHWFRMHRVFPATCGWQSRPPVGVREKVIRGCRLNAGHYEWKGYKYVPSWGGSMFEALMPTLVVDEQAHAPASLGRNDLAHAIIQRRYAVEELGYPVWGLSPSALPEGGYGESGVEILGSRGYRPGPVTPHAAALALEVTPEAAIANLRRLGELYPIYGDFGYYDSVDPRSGRVAYAYLALDQCMILIAIANHLEDGCIQRYFAADPIVQRALPILAEEDFFN